MLLVQVYKTENKILGSKLVDKQSHLGDNEYTAIGFVSQIRAIHPVFSISDNKVHE